MTKDITLFSGGLKLHAKLYLPEKSDKSILLLHGLGFHSFEYESLAPLLVERGFNCLALDFRCCGKSEGLRGYWTLDDLIEDAKNAIQYIVANYPGKIFIFGNSLGATVAVALGARDGMANKLSGIIVSNCATRPKEFALNRLRRMMLFLAGLVNKAIPLRVSVNYFIPYSKIFTRTEFIEMVQKDPLVEDARRFSLSTYKEMLGWDMTKVVPKVRVPLLVLQGGKDGLQKESQSTMLFDAANNPKEYRLIDAGHLPNIENPKLLQEIIVNWLKKY